MSNRMRHRKVDHNKPTITQLDAARSLMGEFKRQVLMMLNETSDEFDAKQLTDAQREAYNDFTSVFGEKVLALNLQLKKVKE